jgi:DNA-directed RNA polymerase specialized sigma24 family protein
MTPADRAALVADGAPVALGIARKLAGPRVPVDELRGEAFLALVYATRWFDPARGVPWRIFAGRVVHQRLTRFVRRWLRQPAAVGTGGDVEPDEAAAPNRADPTIRDPAELVAAGDLCELVRRRLPARWFVLLWQVHAEGRTFVDVGRCRGVRADTVRKTCHMAEARAREAVDRPARGSPTLRAPAAQS